MDAAKNKNGRTYIVVAAILVLFFITNTAEAYQYPFSDFTINNYSEVDSLNQFDFYQSTMSNGNYCECIRWQPQALTQSVTVKANLTQTVYFENAETLTFSIYGQSNYVSYGVVGAHSVFLYVDNDTAHPIYDYQNNVFNFGGSATYTFTPGYHTLQLQLIVPANLDYTYPSDLYYYVWITNAPSIYSWGNTKTNNRSLNATVTSADNVKFNVTAQQPITTWAWSMDGQRFPSPEPYTEVHLTGTSNPIPQAMWDLMDHNGNDTRFNSSDDTVTYPHWIEYLTARDNYSIWVNVTQSNIDSFRWLYNNPAATSSSDSKHSILFYDFFNTTALDESKWGGTSKCTVSNGALECGNQQVYSKQNFTRPFNITTKLLQKGGNGWEFIFGFGNNAFGNFHTMYGDYANTEYINYNEGSNQNVAGTTVSPSVLKLQVLSTGAKAYKNGVYSIQETTTTTDNKPIFLGAGATIAPNARFDWVVVGNGFPSEVAATTIGEPISKGGLWGYYSKVYLGFLGTISTYGNFDNITTNFTKPIPPDPYTEVHLTGTSNPIPQAMWDLIDHNGNDTRFNNSDGSVIYPHWIEYITARDNYSIWVNVTQSDVSSFRWLYNNSAATSSSDSKYAIWFFDNFDTLDTSKWNVGTGCSASGGILTCAPTGGGTEQIYSKQNFTRPLNITVKLLQKGGNGWMFFFGYGNAFNANFHTMYGDYAGTEYINYNEGSNQNVAGTTVSIGTLKLQVLSTGAKAYKNGVYSIQETTTTTDNKPIFLGSGADAGSSAMFDWVAVGDAFPSNASVAEISAPISNTGAWKYYSNVNLGTIHSISAYGTNINGTSNTVIWNVLVSTLSGAATTFSASGYVYWAEIDGTTDALENALVKINETLFDFSDALGNYQISNVPNGVYTIYVNKTEAFSTTSGTTSDSSPDNDFTLLYAKPLMGAPYVSGSNTIYGTYSHNIYPITLWNNPVYIWGEYRYDDLNGTAQDKPYYKTCSYISGSIFECPKDANRAYTFRFIYSDKWNNDLTSWHPSLTGSRNFSSPHLYLSTGGAGGGSPSAGDVKTPKQKEGLIQVNFWNALLITIVFLLMIIIKGFSDRNE